jgi:tRNA(Met) cytidine acetyltransferase
LLESHQRALLLLQGSHDWRLQQAQVAVTRDASTVISDDASIQSATPLRNVDNLLGLEFDVVLLDLSAGLNLDVFCMSAGLVRAGGLLVLLAPERLGEIDDRYSFIGGSPHPGWFIDWQLQRLAQSEIFFNYQRGQPAPDLPSLPVSSLTEIEAGLTREQAELARQLESWLTAHSSALFVVTADRGRGKSALLGYFARRQSSYRVTVTAASRAQAAILLQHADSQKHIDFMAPDEMIRRNQRVELLLIDEAAVLPMGVLWRCLELADKALLATTTGGYEGSGQGFLLRFLKQLKTGSYTRASIRQPVRWGQHDLLENCLNQELLLRQTPGKVLSLTDAVDYQLYDKQRLREERSMLESIYRLLVSAHYRTRPSDLRQLLEDPNQEVIVARVENEVVGVLLLLVEGGFDRVLCDDVFMGRRRPAGHLLAQMLTAQAGIRNFAMFRGGRVQRIAVESGLRRRGIGRGLVQTARELVEKNGLEYLGASFALDASSLEFWHATGFDLVHIGAAPGRSSGRQSIAMLQSDDTRIKPLIEQQWRELSTSLPVLFLTRCSQLHWQDAQALLALAAPAFSLTPQQKDQLDAFAHGYRGLEYSLPSLQKLLLNESRHLDQLDPDIQRLLIEKIVFNRQGSTLQRGQAQPGRKAILGHLRRAVATLLERGKPPEPRAITGGKKSS